MLSSSRRSKNLYNKHLKFNEKYYKSIYKSIGKTKNSLNKNKNKNKNRSVLKPPFKKGMYSFKSNIFQKNSNTARTSHYSNYNILYSNSSHRSNSKSKYYIQNNKIKINKSLLYYPSINLNKYKINIIINDKDKKINFKNINSNDSIEFNNINKKKQNQLTLDLDNLKHVKKRKTFERQYQYKDYFSDRKLNEVESRRMLIEYIKILNKNVNNVNKVLKDYNISKKVLNKKYNDYEDNDNFELFGDAKKEMFLKNLNYSFISDVDISGEDNEYSNTNILSLNNLANLLPEKVNKKINILHFLCVPTILNLIGENDIKEQYIFLVMPDESVITEPKENYIFQWRDMSTNEIENEFNINLIKQCMVSEKYKNRFIIEVVKDDNNFFFEIETPSKELCDNYISGINYLKQIINKS